MLLNGIYIISEDPLVILGTPVWQIIPYLPRGIKSNLQIVLSWYRGNPRGLAKTAYLNYKYALKYKNIDICWTTNTQDEEFRFRLLGLKALFLNHNTFCSDFIFKPASLAKEWDALYVASLSPYKRIDLLQGIDRLRIVARNPGNGQEYLESLGVTATLNEGWIKRKELCSIINQSYAGLALSKVEGAMYASTEYLLCGIPVISTPSKGGRDVWFTPNNHVLVEPNPKSVKDAIERVKRGGFSQELIARETRETMRRFREKYLNLLKDEFDLEFSYEDLFGGYGLYKKFVLGRNAKEFFQSYKNGRFERQDLKGTTVLDAA